jgi:hypothetical protein
VPHLDHDRLVLLALGDEPLTADSTDHLDGCPDCATQYATLRHVAGLGAQTQELRDLPAPPERVWAAIAAQTGVAAGTAAGQPAVVTGAGGRRRAGTGPGGSAPPTGRPGTTGAGRRGSRGVLRLGLVALLGAVLGIGGTLGVQALRDNGSSPPATVVASGTFAPKAPAAQGASGEAAVVETGDGLRLRITVAGMPPPQGIYEAWLYNPGTGAMIPLGGMSATGGEYDVSGYDLGAFTVVDVSAQTFDGTQGHGESMLQAPLA